MKWQDTVAGWKDAIPTEERLRKVQDVIYKVFQKKEWKSGTHIKVTDDRLLFFKKVVHKQDDKVAQDGSFQIIVENKLVKKFYIKRLLYMIDIIEHVNNAKERYERWKNEKRP